MLLTSRGKFSLGVLSYWLQRGRIDIEQGEGLGLDRGWGGNQGKAVGVIESGGHLIESAGGKVAQQAVEAVDRTAIGGEFAGTLAQRGRRGLGRRADRGVLASGGGGVIVVKQHGFEALAHVPLRPAAAAAAPCPRIASPQPSTPADRGTGYRLACCGAQPGTTVPVPTAAPPAHDVKKNGQVSQVAHTASESILNAQ